MPTTAKGETHEVKFGQFFVRNYKSWPSYWMVVKNLPNGRFQAACLSYPNSYKEPGGPLAGEVKEFPEEGKLVFITAEAEEDLPFTHGEIEAFKTKYAHYLKPASK